MPCLITLNVLLGPYPCLPFPVPLYLTPCPPFPVPPRFSCRLLPFEGANGPQVMALLLNGKRPYIPPARMDVYVSTAVQATRPHSKEDGVPLPIARIIEACWEQNPFDRPAFSQVSV